MKTLLILISFISFTWGSWALIFGNTEINMLRGIGFILLSFVSDNLAEKS